jgi:ribosome-associated translation inhibitor RaiA
MITQFDISTTKDALKKAKQAIDQALDLIERFDQATDDLEKEITKISNRPERD